MTKRILKLITPIALLGLMIFSCKKSEDSTPAPVVKIPLIANADTFYVKSDFLLCNVFTNDINPRRADSVNFEFITFPDIKFTRNSDSTFTCTRINKNYADWITIQYDLNGVNSGIAGNAGYSAAKVHLRIGSDAQWQTKTLLANPAYHDMAMFAVDGDTSVRKKWGGTVPYFYQSLSSISMAFADMSKEKSQFFLNNQFAIDNDGIVNGTYLGSSSVVQFKVLGEFKGKAIDKNGQTIDVSGLSFYFLGRKHDYISQYSQLKYNFK